MTAPSRARFRAPWLALPLALATILTGAPAYADDVPSLSVSPSTGLADEQQVTVSVTLPATITSTAGAELVTGVYVMYCVQPSGAIGTAAGRATGAQCDAARQLYLVASSGPAGGTVAGSVADGAWTFTATLPAADAFGAHACLAAASATEQCGVFIRLYHGFHAGNVANPYQYDAFLPVTFAAPPPAYTPGITVTPATGLADGAALTVSGAFPSTITGTSGSALVTGVYLMYCVQPAGAAGTAAGRATGAQCDATRQQYLVASAGPAGGTVAGTVTSGVWTFSTPIDAADSFGAHECLAAAAAAGEQCGVFVRLYHGFHAGNVANPYQYDQFVPVTFAAPVVDPGTPTTPTTPTTPAAAAPRLTVNPSTIDPSVATTVTIRGTGYTGAGAANGVYVNIGSAATWQPGQVPAQGGWIASGWVQPGSLSSGAFTTQLTVPAGALTAGGSYGAATFAAHGLALTDRSLDAWRSLTLATAGTGTASTDRTVASAPPSTDGIEVEEAELEQGGTVTATASGFAPNETGILVVVYSDPVVLDNQATADADGTVRWTGRLPGGLTGSHTLTFQGSVDVGVPIVIAPRQAEVCAIDDARIDWGFKESFRSYLSGSIANGEWTTSGDAGYETPSFFFTGGTGDRDEQTARVAVRFDGTVRFTGHGGALDTTIANPRIEVGTDSATLLLDVTGTTQDGRDLVRVGVPFADLDLAGIEAAAADGAIVLSGIPATLTADGAEVFGTYPAGEALDPVTLTIPEGDCGSSAGSAIEAAAQTGAPGPVWPIWLAVALALALAAAIGAVLIVRRRRA